MPATSSFENVTGGHLPSNKRGGAHRFYCLRCFATLPRLHERCVACGFLSRPFDRRTFWNRAPKLRAFEGAVKGAIAIFTIALCWFVLSKGVHNRIAGYSIAAPVLLGAFHWTCAGLITRHGAGFRALRVWIVTLAACAATLWIAWHAGAHLPTGERLSETTLRNAEMCLLLGAMGGVVISRKFQRWKARLVDGETLDL